MRRAFSLNENYKAPFIIVGAVNLIVMLGGLWLRAREAKDRGKLRHDRKGLSCHAE